MTATELYDLGLSVIPATTRKAPAVAWKSYQTRTPSRDEFDGWARANPPVWGIVTGAVSRRVVLDFDGADGQRTLERLGLRPHVITPSGGAHIHVAHPGFPVSTQNHISASKKPWSVEWPGLDIRGDGGFEALIGATDRGAYRIVRDLSDIEPWGALPANFRRHFEPKHKAPIEDELLRRALELAASSGRNEGGLWLACQLRDNGLSESEADVTMGQFCSSVGSLNRKGEREPYTLTEARESLRSAYSRAPREPWQEPRTGGRSAGVEPALMSEPGIPDAVDLISLDLNDNGNAERLIRLHGSNLRYCHGFRKWLWYDGRRWAVDDTDQARRLVKDAMLQTARQANESRAEAVLKWATRSLDHRRLTSALSLAECEIFVRPVELDTNPDLLNFLNGTVNLRTGEIVPHDPQHFITKLVHHRYRPEAECPNWLAFLARIMGAHADASEAELDAVDRLIGYLQRSKGYSLTGHTSEKAVFVPFGGGNNGKTTMLSVYAGTITEYATSIQADTLMVRQESNNTQADLADLRGARFVQTSETEQGQRLAQGKLKRITQGMGVIKAVRKYENPIEFPETHKLWMDTNRKPVIRDADDKATFNRLHPIPFTVTIPEGEIDRELPTKLRAEAEGILAWAVKGARQWYTGGLQRPEEIDRARQAWRDEDDQIGRWIEERCITGEDYSGKASALYSDYQKWTDESGERERLSSNVFGQRLESRGHLKVHKDSGNHYVCIALGVRV